MANPHSGKSGDPTLDARFSEFLADHARELAARVNAATATDGTPSEPVLAENITIIHPSKSLPKDSCRGAERLNRDEAAELEARLDRLNSIKESCLEKIGDRIGQLQRFEERDDLPCLAPLKVALDNVVENILGYAHLEEHEIDELIKPRSKSGRAIRSGLDRSLGAGRSGKWFEDTSTILSKLAKTEKELAWANHRLESGHWANAQLRESQKVVELIDEALNAHAKLRLPQEPEATQRLSSLLANAVEFACHAFTEAFRLWLADNGVSRTLVENVCDDMNALVRPTNHERQETATARLRWLRGVLQGIIAADAKDHLILKMPVTENHRMDAAAATVELFGEEVATKVGATTFRTATAAAPPETTIPGAACGAVDAPTEPNRPKWLNDKFRIVKLTNSAAWQILGMSGRLNKKELPKAAIKQNKFIVQISANEVQLYFQNEPDLLAAKYQYPELTKGKC